MHPIESTCRVIWCFPDGCLDLLFYREENLECYVVGAMTRARSVQPVRNTHYIGVRFRPGGLSGLLHCPLDELTDQRIPTTCFPELADLYRVSEDPDPQTCIADLDRSLQLLLLKARPDPRIVHATGLLEHHPDVSVSSLAEELGLSRQHLRRLFLRHCGLTVKQYARIHRLQSLKDTIERGEIMSWSDLALDCGYYDQAHMINEFRTFAGVTPKHYLQSQVKL